VIEHRADVYALGAMLYHVLAGRPPYERLSSADTIAEVLAGAPESLTTRAPEAPPELVSVVEKAMARDAAHRYPTAREMASELERFMAGQRLASHEYSMASLARRFVVRHRAVVFVAVVLSAALVIGAALSVRRVARERDHARRMEALALTREQAARVQRDAAEKLVEFMVVDLRAKLESVGRLDVMEGLGGEVLRYYRATSAYGELEDARSLARRAAAVSTLAAVDEERHDLDRAREGYRLSIEIGERALALDARSADARYAAGDALVQLAALEISAGDLDVARSLLDRARGFAIPEATAKAIDRARAVYLAGRIDQRFAWIEQQRGDLELAYRMASRSRDELAEAVTYDASARWRVELSYAWQLLGTLDVERGELERASDEHQQAIAIRAMIRDAMPSPSVDLEQSFAYASLGEVAVLRKDFAKAAVAYQSAYELRVALASRDPANAEWQRYLALAKSDLCTLAQRRMDLTVAASACDGALDILEHLALAQPKNAKVQRDLAFAHRSVGRVRLARGSSASAVVAFAAGVAVARALVEGDPKNTTNQQILARTERWLGRGQLAARNTDAARETFERARAIAAPLFEQSPRDATNQEELASIELLGGDIARARRDEVTARRLYHSALDRFADLAARAPANAEYIELRDEAAHKL
jgi:tetratricopeptide (TPR) repeat protein